MVINFQNISQMLSATFQINKNSQKPKLSFKGDEILNPADDKQFEAVSSYASVQVHPVFALNMQLLKDGYTKEEIAKHKILSVIDINDSIFAQENLLDDVLDKKITKDDIFSEKSKTHQDVQAMQKAYLSLRDKFNTSDVQNYIFEMNKIFCEFEKILKEMGKNLDEGKSETHRDMILSVLHYVNQYNESLVQDLLNDKNFNNIYIEKALLTMNKPQDVKYGLEVLKLAQEIGYDKDFSFALSVLISEANEKNMSMIEKMLYEQEFLSENEDFVAEKLMNFLRSAGYGLAKDYVESDEVTLNIVQELFEMDKNSEE